MTLEGNVAIVTGASRGIGEYVAKHLARAGASVVVAARTQEVSDPRLPGTIHSVAAAITEEGGAALAVPTDMRDPDSIEACAQRTVEAFGRLDIIVNNAAILVPGDLLTVQPRHIDLMWQIDLRGPVLLCRAAVPHMQSAGGGHIINVSSRAAVFPGPGPYGEDQLRTSGAFYAMVKAGLERFTQALAVEYQASNIAANVLSPKGRVKTPGNVFAENDREHPNLDFEPAEEMGKAAVWICEQRPPTYTGNIVYDRDICEAQSL